MFARTYIRIHNHILLCSLLFKWVRIIGWCFKVEPMFSSFTRSLIKLILRTFFWNKISLTQFLFFYTQSTNPTLFLLIQNASKHYQKSMTKKTINPVLMMHHVKGPYVSNLKTFTKKTTNQGCTLHVPASLGKI